MSHGTCDSRSLFPCLKRRHDAPKRSSIFRRHGRQRLDTGIQPRSPAHGAEAGAIRLNAFLTFGSFPYIFIHSTNTMEAIKNMAQKVTGDNNPGGVTNAANVSHTFPVDSLARLCLSFGMQELTDSLPGQTPKRESSLRLAISRSKPKRDARSVFRTTWTASPSRPLPRKARTATTTTSRLAR